LPTTNPRISITLQPEELAILDRFSAASGTPRATVLSGLVATVLPELEKAAELIEMANAAPRHVQQGLVESLSAATKDAMGFMEGFHDTYKTAMARVQRELPLPEQKPSRRKPSGRKGASAPGPVAAAKTPTY
jgi:hypothetical protein